MNWQPIQTAPRDGREFLALWEDQGNVMQIVRFNTVDKYFETKGRPLLGFITNADYWIELPSPP